ncbi:hypothetical protein KTT_57820 [Tengunoibacter tsumagoiensis]|uniref:Uncharacterized protein n=1 Tax=Tengunoibacter tsumagoiensis TaxID=2014871 RepID=A0A402A9U3_9CHLR|nr:hypothetical protein KTT_57820 [Tengunoibacter tsumagoiensis]
MLDLVCRQAWGTCVKRALPTHISKNTNFWHFSTEAFYTSNAIYYLYIGWQRRLTLVSIVVVCVACLEDN